MSVAGARTSHARPCCPTTGFGLASPTRASRSTTAPPNQRSARCRSLRRRPGSRGLAAPTSTEATAATGPVDPRSRNPDPRVGRVATSPRSRRCLDHGWRLVARALLFIDAPLLCLPLDASLFLAYRSKQVVASIDAIQKRRGGVQLHHRFHILAAADQPFGLGERRGHLVEGLRPRRLEHRSIRLQACRPLAQLQQRFRRVGDACQQRFPSLVERTDGFGGRVHQLNGVAVHADDLLALLEVQLLLGVELGRDVVPLRVGSCCRRIAGVRLVVQRLQVRQVDADGPEPQLTQQQLGVVEVQRLAQVGRLVGDLLGHALCLSQLLLGLGLATAHGNEPRATEHQADQHRDHDASPLEERDETVARLRPGVGVGLVHTGALVLRECQLHRLLSVHHAGRRVGVVHAFPQQVVVDVVLLALGHVVVVVLADVDDRHGVGRHREREHHHVPTQRTVGRLQVTAGSVQVVQVGLDVAARLLLEPEHVDVAVDRTRQLTRRLRYRGLVQQTASRQVDEPRRAAGGSRLAAWWCCVRGHEHQPTTGEHQARQCCNSSHSDLSSGSRFSRG